MEEDERYFQITIIAVDTMPENGEFRLTGELIEESFRRNPLPQLLKLSDVEVVHVGSGTRIHPNAADVQHHRDCKRNVNGTIESKLRKMEEKE